MAAPVGSLVRPIDPLASFDSLKRCASRMIEAGLPSLPVTVDNHVVGVVSEASLAKALAAGLSPESSIGPLMTQAPPTIRPYESLASALRLLEESGFSFLLVADDAGSLVGVVRAADLLSGPRPPLRPRMVGGMATPLGVYLTTGTLGAGATGLGLVLTGAMLFALFFLASIVANQLNPLLSQMPLSRSGVETAIGGSSLILFLIGLRALPLAGTHGAEHMVVHAIERGEELTPSIVSRMPRVHPRCGTNLAAGAVLFLSLNEWRWTDDTQLRFLIAALLTVLLWRPIGSLLQHFVTTRRPSERQLKDAISAGNQLLTGYQTARYMTPSVARRIWYSGLPHIMIGSTAVAALVQLLDSLGWLRWVGYN